MTATESRTLVLFDGVCNLCNGFVRFILRRDRRDRFRFAQLQNAHAILEKFGAVSGDLRTVVVVSGGKVFTESDAVLKVCEVLGGWWLGFSWLRIIPKGIRDGVYRFIAARRYRWFGRLDQCPAPDAALRQKFLEAELADSPPPSYLSPETDPEK
jgi:predicted DCC family thiol-disulfide oxidoreductase YuxK